MAAISVPAHRNLLEPIVKSKSKVQMELRVRRERLARIVNQPCLVRVNVPLIRNVLVGNVCAIRKRRPHDAKHRAQPVSRVSVSTEELAIIIIRMLFVSVRRASRENDANDWNYQSPNALMVLIVMEPVYPGHVLMVPPATTLARNIIVNAHLDTMEPIAKLILMNVRRPVCVAMEFVSINKGVTDVTANQDIRALCATSMSTNVSVIHVEIMQLA